MVIIVPCHYEIICDEARDIKYSSFNKITHLTMGTSSLNITYGADKSRILAARSSGYVIPMSVMADILSANNLNNRNN